MSPTKRYAKKQAKASQRRRCTAAERLQRDHTQAQRAIEALEQALHGCKPCSTNAEPPLHAAAWPSPRLWWSPTAGLVTQN